jgi:hypothetical protein
MKSGHLFGMNRLIEERFKYRCNLKVFSNQTGTVKKYILKFKQAQLFLISRRD